MALDSCISQIQKDQYDLLPVRFLASVVGQIISLQTVLGKCVSMKTRYLYKCILTRASWNSPVQVRCQAMEELVFWRENVEQMNACGKSLKAKVKIDACMFTDASSVGYGGFIRAR